MILHHHLPSISLVVLALLVFHVCQVFALISPISPLCGVVYANAPYSIKRQIGARSPCILAYHNSTESVDDQLHQIDKDSLSRFYKEADKQTEIPDVCILTIHGNDYNMTNWAKAHPGGAKILQKFHSQDASIAFERAHHSSDAYAMLKEFLVQSNDNNVDDLAQKIVSSHEATTSKRKWFSRLRRKLFTKEDPVGVHKCLGIFCLLNFTGRYFQMLFGDPAAGLGTRGHPWASIACLFPHAMLSLSSLIFQTVPRERVVGKPMIWQEFRVHNILFGVRSVLSAFVAAMAIKAGNTPKIRQLAILCSGVFVLGSNIGADFATSKLRAATSESTTATMPYWEGCSTQTQLRFKGFYAYCQFMATLACLAVGNPAWSLATLLAIQLASLLMTLVRKGLLSAKGYHIGYTLCLVAPWLVGIRSSLFTKTLEFPLMTGFGYVLYKLRRKGISKYRLWIPVILARLMIGDNFITYTVW